MKKILALFCLIMAIYAIYFPLTYFKSNDDKMEVRVSHIYTENKNTADKIKQEMDNGKPFNDLAKEYSECPSKEINGDLGYVQRGRYDKSFEQAVFSTPEKHITNLVKSEFGWHIIKIDKIKYFSDKENFKYKQYKYLDL